ncbi:FAD-dependent oxidoreductase [Xylophilus ampelinus]|uniref:Glycine oxidase n=1 Tax=Xylophilus ampelinus TaxID=54067 RepID=A0A318SRY4_9BURK|nr:FAD-dependent oxidoreductase [Xylophilus ampelinus]MCS4510939.1 FAD-dependent oxidoreductase [Xylophilus ampelinus]PYE76099.1 glycine oxidase [Xylophilus ampelinus]
MPLTLGIAGAGLLGRLTAWQLGRAGHRVDVFDPASGPVPTYDGHGAAGFSAAGMLSPLAELDHADAAIAALGWRSLALWPRIAAALGAPALFAQRGSLLLAHRTDRGAAERVLGRLARASAAWPQPQTLDADALQALEPSLHRIAHAWLLPQEGQIDPPATLALLHARAADTVRWHWGRPVAQATAGQLTLADGTRRRFDRVLDLRGLGAGADAMPHASADDPDSDPDSHDGAAAAPLPLRGVRGETAWLHAPSHGLSRPVRLLHPRHAVYIVPRGPDRVFVGASEIESEDRSPVSLRSAVELMAAAHSVLPALAEARIERLDRNLRPALPDNLPRTEVGPGLLRINGLFRHGWLMAPALVADALATAGLATPALPDTPPEETRHA